MTREYARVKVKIWADTDFRDLTDPAQSLYFRLLSSPTMNLCGVADWRPKRIAALTRGMTAERVEEAAQELVERGYIVVDEDTEEVLIRSFVRHDGLIKTPNIAASMAKDYAGTASALLRGVIVFELVRMKADEPEMKGWSVASHLLSEPSINPSVMPSLKASGMPSVIPSEMPLPNGSGNGSHIPQPSALNPQPSSSSSTKKNEDKDLSARRGRFDEFWSIYPKRGKHSNPKEPARQKWNDLVRTVDPEAIIESARLLAKVREGEDPQTTPQTITWLRQKRWQDDPVVDTPARHLQSVQIGPSRDAQIRYEEAQAIAPDAGSLPW